jgi:agmatinase
MKQAVLNIQRNFLAIEPEFSSFENSRVAIVSAPYEQTVSYGGGTKFGPEAILKASHYVEFFDEETNREIYKEHGICTLPPLKLAKKKNEAALQIIYNEVEGLLKAGKFVVTLGGEHTISSATIAAHAKRYPDLSVVQFDAHSDLRMEYQGNKYSHASVMARVCEFLDPKRLIQVGIRAQCREEAEFIRENGVNTYYAHIVNAVQYKDRTVGFLKHWMDDALSKMTENVYISFDVDGFDPAIMPATGTPEPNGLQWNVVMEFIRRIGRKKKIVGFDVVELAPIKGLHHPDLTTAKLVSKILNCAI